MSVDISTYKITDIYTGLVVRASTPEDLSKWLEEKQVTKTDGFYKTVKDLVDCLKNGEDPHWHAAANGLRLDKKKTRR